MKKLQFFILGLFLFTVLFDSIVFGYCGVNSYGNRYCTDGYTYEYWNNQVPGNPYYGLPYYKGYGSNNGGYTYEYWYIINPSAVYLTPDEECDLKYPGTIYRASDNRCACEGDEKGTSSRNKDENCKKNEIKENENTLNKYSTLYRRAYNFSREMGITTMYPIDNAKMFNDVTRGETAKMLSSRMKGYKLIPDTSKNCVFKDINSAQGDLGKYIIEACQFGVMGQGIDKFRPNDNISRGEIATAISRIIWGNKFNGGTPYYSQHMDALSKEGILPNSIPYYQNEKRGDLMVMLLNASNGYTTCNDIENKVLCSIERYENNYKECPAICRDVPGVADEQTLLEVTGRTSLEDHTVITDDDTTVIPNECYNLENKVLCSIERYKKKYEECPVYCRDVPGVADEQTLLGVTGWTSLEDHIVNN